MWRRERVLIRTVFTGMCGVGLLFFLIGWWLWQNVLSHEESEAGSLALDLGRRTEAIILDTRDLLAEFDQLPGPRCTAEHLQALQDAAISRPYLRAIGHWRATERLCSVGFLQTRELKPPRADRIYDSGVIAWWPSSYTEVGGVQLFLIRFGDHDAALDPRLLLELGPSHDRQVGLWVENLHMVSLPADAQLPPPLTLPVGVTVDREAGRVLSRFSRDSLMPIDVVAIEPLQRYWDRHARTLAVGGAVGLILGAIWLYLLLRYSRRRLSLAGELAEALQAGRVQAHYQPVVDLKTGRCVGAEALARWTRDNGEAVPPDTFIPIAEQAGLVSTITLTALHAVVRDLQKLRKKAPDLSINLNLCPEDLKNENFADTLARSLTESALPPGAIKLEITERALINSDTARLLIRHFRERGHQIAIDDFGTGYSSLSYLQSFELDLLKIDKSFVDAIGTAAATSQVVVHVIEMARALGLELVAEGVQTEEQRQWLIEHGVHYGQGYLFSPPMRVDSLIEFLDRSPTS